MDDFETGSIDLTADLAAQTGQLKQLTSLSRQFGTSISDAFARGSTSGKGLEGVLKGLGDRLSQIALRSAFKPLESALGQAFDTLTKSVLNPLAGNLGGTLIPSAQGNVVAQGRIVPFAAGGVVSRPTYFPLGRDTGLAGEAGPEAILPLARGADGRLGVRAGGGGARPMNVTVNVTTPDADSFRRSETQVAASLARAVARGQRGL